MNIGQDEQHYLGSEPWLEMVQGAEEGVSHQRSGVTLHEADVAILLYIHYTFYFCDSYF